MKIYTPTLSWLVTILIPLALIGLAVRVVLIPAYLQIKYRMPYFPPDDYGFTLEDRLRWGLTESITCSTTRTSLISAI